MKRWRRAPGSNFGNTMVSAADVRLRSYNCLNDAHPPDVILRSASSAPTDRTTASRTDAAERIAPCRQPRCSRTPHRNGLPPTVLRAGCAAAQDDNFQMSLVAGCRWTLEMARLE